MLFSSIEIFSGKNVHIGTAVSLMAFKSILKHSNAEFSSHLFIDSGLFVHCGMAASVGTLWFSAPLNYKSGPNVCIGTLVTLMAQKISIQN